MKSPHILLSLFVGSMLVVSAACAKEYTCPESIRVEPGHAQTVEGFQLWNNPQSTARIQYMSLYDGYPGELASLEPDDGDDPHARGDYWTLSGDSYWISCSYTSTDVELVKRLDPVKKILPAKRPQEDRI